MIWRTIEHLRTRPREERVAFAGTVAVGVMIVLFLGWAVFFLHSLRTSSEAAQEAVTTGTE
jgi:hypothetical protein